MPIRPGALPHSIAVIRRLGDGTEADGATLKVRIDPLDGTEPQDVDEADWLVMLGPEADGQIAGADAFVWLERTLELEAKGPALPFYDGLGRLHHLELTAQLAPGYPEVVTIIRLGRRTGGVLNLTTADFEPSSTAEGDAPARIRATGATGASANSTLVGDDPATLTTWTATVPFSVGDILPEDRLIVTASKTPELEGVEFRVLSLGDASHHRGRVLFLERQTRALEPDLGSGGS